MAYQPVPGFRPRPAASQRDNRQTPYLWLFIGTATVALILGGLWVWSEVRGAQARADLEGAQRDAIDAYLLVRDYEDAVDECRAAVLAYIEVAQAQNDTISAYAEGFQAFFSTWNYRAGDVSVIYEGVDRAAPARDAAFDAAEAATCEHP